ncbi:MAG: single-stranded-DNA-specific exonuclease RecJ [Christensenellaceae bacterium]|nr:single-stranded-DNA-specific exonuclease RecJ [Christensenellaceae bacterium]
MAIYSGAGLDEKICRILLARGVDTREKFKEFKDFSLEKLHNPFLLKGMQDAADRIQKAIQTKEKILIIGDYDCDGISATAIMYKYLLSRHANTSYFLPDRVEDGYGLNLDLIRALNEKFAPKLIITVDCGISCPDEIELAKSLGVDCIVTDHHTIPEKIPDCICIDPKLPDQSYPFNDLCGAGVALKVVQALSNLQTAEKYLDLAALATIADIVSLTDENRVIVKRGLDMINSGSNIGLSALIKQSKLSGTLKSTDISYKVSPKINAAGRMGNAKRGLDLLLENDPTRIPKIVESLSAYNVARQDLCNNIYAEAERIVEENTLFKQPIIIVSSPEWESGVLGIVAAKLTEKYNIPALVMGQAANILKGSARSTPNINIVEAMARQKDLLVSFGGHHMAAGVSIDEKNFEAFKAAILGDLNNILENQDDTATKYYDLALDLKDLTKDFISGLEILEPYGCGNPTPLFALECGKLEPNRMPSYPQHLKIATKGVSMTYFNGAPFFEILKNSIPKLVLIEIQNDTFSARSKYVCAIIRKVVVPNVRTGHDFALVLERIFAGDLKMRTDDGFKAFINSLKTDRDAFIGFYKDLKRLEGTKMLGGYFTLFMFHIKRGSVAQFIFACKVFEDLGILKLENNIIKIDDSKKTDFADSKTFNLIKSLQEN